MATFGFPWTCPTCGRHTTITLTNFQVKTVDVFCSVTQENAGVRLRGRLIECPNQACRAQQFTVTARHGKVIKSQAGADYMLESSDLGPVGIGEFTFLPTTAQPLSEHVPSGVREDYNEAYLIRDLSPKASATLARRALQGMVRDFWSVTGMRTLHQELESIKDRCNHDLYEAMMAVKSVGNIGAHPDINTIVDVEEGEPAILLELIHLLDREWYVARADQQRRIEKMKALGAAKAIAPPPK